MNKAALITTGKRLSGDDLFLLSVFDLEPSGIIVHAYNQANSKEYVLPITEMEMAKASITRRATSLMELLETIMLVEVGNDFGLESSNEKLPRVKRRPNVEELEAMMKAPISEGCQESMHDLLTRGLVELCKVKPVGLAAIEWLGEWLISNNPNKPNVEDPDE